ncbi:MAG: tripartite tricarboxylate transporter substrate binding protein [Proteobacteria bacterium]|nr:tripartite tricarboxylate transporter substrate binding protein [Pseudomonadota bacterium]
MGNILRFAIIAVLMMTQSALAQTYPTKPVKIIVPFAPGGSSDGSMRPIAERLSALLGQPFIIENRPGALATIGANIVAKAEPDGYTLLLMPGTHVLATRMMKSVPYHPFNDFTPIANLVFSPYVVTAAKKQPFTTLKDMVAYAKANPGNLMIGNSDIVTWLAAEMLGQVANVKLTHVNYKGGGPVAADVVGGHLPLGMASTVAVQGFLKDRKVTGLAVTSPKRIGSMPDIPTVAEALGVSYDAQTWYALAGPAGVPRPIVDRIQRAVAQVLMEPQVRERLTLMGVEPAEDTTPEGMANLMKTFSQKNIALMDAVNFQAE